VALMLTALQGHFTQISLKVRKLRREREWSVLTAVSTVGQTMTEPEKSSESDSCRKCWFSVICSAVARTPKLKVQLGARWVTIIMKKKQFLK